MKNTSRLAMSMSLIGSAIISFPMMAMPVAIPNPPELNSKGYVLIDYHSGEVLVEKNAHGRLNPASLTKLMTAYAAGMEIRSGSASLDDVVVISENAWAKKFPDSSKMFIEVGKEVALSDLYRGLIIQSGNDASVAIAEHIAGSVDGFVGVMNSWATQLELKNTSFSNPHGLDSEALYSTPYDIGMLGRAIIRDLPDIYPMYQERSFTYNGITQYNRNGLLRDPMLNVDGMKTGYTKGAGYSLATSATEGKMRLIAVVMGAKSIQARESQSKQLLSYGFRFYETLNPHTKEQSVTQARIWMGNEDTLDIGVNETVYLSVLKSQADKVEAELVLGSNLEAPILQGDKMGQVNYLLDGEVIHSADLVALHDVEQGSWFKRVTDWVTRWFSNLF